MDDSEKKPGNSKTGTLTDRDKTKLAEILVEKLRSEIRDEQERSGHQR